MKSAIIVPEKWQKIKHIFLEASDKTGKERTDYILKASGNDSVILAEVQKLLKIEEAPTSWLEYKDDEASIIDEEIIPKKIGNYNIAGVIGRGGMGTVYRGIQVEDHFSRNVAIKIAHHKSHLSINGSRLTQECKILASLNHPGIAHIYAAGTLEGRGPYFVMELIDGEPIDDYCRINKLTTREILRLCLQVIEAVRYAHSQGVVHRDIKPKNILVTQEEKVKLLDFGIAKVIQRSTSGLQCEDTGTDHRLMTPAFAAPEQIVGQPITPTTDIYQIGLLIKRIIADVVTSSESEYDKINGNYDYSENKKVYCDNKCNYQPASNYIDCYHFLNKLYPINNSKYNEDELLRNILSKALNKDPVCRYQSASQMYDAIQHHLRSERVDDRKLRGKIAWQRSTIFKTSAIIVSVIPILYFIITISLERYSEDLHLDGIGFALTSEAINLFDRINPNNDKRSVDELLDIYVTGIRKKLANKPRLLARYLSEYARTCHRNGSLGKAIAVSTEALKITEELHDLDEIKIDILITLGSAESDAGLLTSSKRNLTQAEKLNSRLSNPSYESRVRLSAAMARLMRLSGDPKKSLQMVKNAIDYFAKSNDFEIKDYLLFNELAAISEQNLGNYDKAENILRSNLEIRKSISNVAPTELVNNLNNLAVVLEKKYLATKDTLYLIEAESLLSYASVIGKNSGLDDHPILANAYCTRGVILGYLGRLVKSEKYLRKALSIYQTERSFHHPVSVLVHHALAFTLDAKGKESESLEQRKLAAQIAGRVYGRSHKETARFLYELSMALTDVNPEEALIHGLQSLNNLESEHGDGSPEVQKALMQVGKLYLILEEAENALPYLTRAYEVRKRDLPAGHWRIASSESMLGEALYLLGKHDEAAPLLESGYATLLRERGAADEKVIAAKKRLSKIQGRLISG